MDAPTTTTLPVAPPSLSKAGAPPFYCPGCGSRYFAPGVCTNQHAALALERDPEVPLPTDRSEVPHPTANELLAQSAAALGAAVPVAPAAPVAPPADVLGKLAEIRQTVEDAFDRVEQHLRGIV